MTSHPISDINHFVSESFDDRGSLVKYLNEVQPIKWQIVYYQKGYSETYELFAEIRSESPSSTV